MLKQVLGITTVLLLTQPALAAWQRLDLKDVSIDIVSDRSHRELPEYPVENRGDTYRAYLEAERGEEYSIQVHNRSGERIGLVIAVDGRNIISGEQSHLRPNERMYILNPYQRATYRGWRSSKNHVNRFYFTDAPDSYAGRWGDYSAMGVIAVAAYAEERPRDYEDQYTNRERAPSLAPRNAPQHKSAPSADAGTGFGDREWSPSRRVEFDPMRKPFGRYFIKYEWRQNLCELGIVRCRPDRHSRRPNRMWDDDNRYAPYPPGVTYWRDYNRR